MCPSAVEFLQEESRKVHSSMVRIGLQNIALKYFSAGSPSLAISLLFRHHDLDGLLSLLDQHVVEEFSELVITTLFQCSEDIGIPQMAVHPSLFARSPSSFEIGPLCANRHPPSGESAGVYTSYRNLVL
mgnify:CR=1 FL=1